MLTQRTIKNPVEIKGAGLQTGKNVTLRVRGAPENSGINFIRTDLPNKPLLNIQSFAIGSANQKERRTNIGKDELQIQTTEHLLAALSGLSIDNVILELDNEEPPGLDGSAASFVEALKKGGFAEQNAEKKILKISAPIWRADGDAVLIALPDEGFKISYTLSYQNSALGTQYFSILLNEDSFAREIAPARTFCLETEAAELLKRGLGKGANYDNTLVIGKAGPIKTAFRFADEPVRHKILDLIGDLYLVGMPLRAHIIAIKSGHKLNMELVKKLKGLLK